MRLFLLPISSRRTLIYCQRLKATIPEQQTWLDKGTVRAAKIWAGWEKKESGWQKKVVEYGNQALRRIPYQEWGLKSIPPLSASARRKAEEQGNPMVEVSFPPTLIPEATVTEVLRKLGTERQNLHRKRMFWSFVAMPISAPVALVPIVPNIPFFYLVFRAYSHWRALNGSKHIEFLLDKKRIATKPSGILDELYSTGDDPFDTTSVSSRDNLLAAVPDGTEEKMLLHKSNSKRIAEALAMPELEMELDRAIWQVEKALKATKELGEEKKELDKANAGTKEGK